MKSYDMIVIGSGSGALNIGVFMVRAGFQVLMIEKNEANIGGDCLNSGCVPSKALIHISREVAAARRSQEYGVKVSGKVNFAKVRKYIESKQEEIRVHENKEYFESLGFDVVIGEAEFAGKHEVRIGEDIYKAKKILVAIGGRPRKLQIPGIDKLEYGKTYLDNETVFQMNELPKELVVIGGGPIGLEIGQALQRLGSQVTVVQREDTFLPKEHPDVTPILKERLEAEGMQFMMGYSPKKVLTDHALEVVDAKGKKQTLSFDGMLVAIGRELNTMRGLDLAGVEVDEQGRMRVDEYLQTSNPDILVAGDSAGGFQFTHAAELHAQVILKNLFSPFKKKLSWDSFGWVTFTDPEIATFGRSEVTLNNQGIDFQLLEIDLEDEDRELIDENHGKLRLYVSGKKILGGTMIGSGAGELVQELLLSVSAGLTTDAIFGKVYPYPTAARINKKAIQKLYAGKLSERNKSILKFLFRFFG
jgi:pyruvate/2-oxoglutarate dehydrogenase complex dihydrolipoamide dehydrogenase (E3) component